MTLYTSFSDFIENCRQLMLAQGETTKVERWQGMDVDKLPFSSTIEVLNVSGTMPIPDNQSAMQDDIKPNLPWAEYHFRERVCGLPLNPGIQWRNWPWASHSDRFREAEQFNHNYMERYWPRFAGILSDDVMRGKGGRRGLDILMADNDCPPRRGIRYDYGDLQNVVELLVRDPTTRQAYLPVWFPEDTGVVHRGRVPCSLGYHFIRRQGQLHIVYYLRSCDYVRHFRDDLYLTARLVPWMIASCALSGEFEWGEVKPGTLTIHITSLHCFEADRHLLERGK